MIILENLSSPTPSGAAPTRLGMESSALVAIGLTTAPTTQRKIHRRLELKATETKPRTRWEQLLNASHYVCIDKIYPKIVQNLQPDTYPHSSSANENV